MESPRSPARRAVFRDGAQIGAVVESDAGFVAQDAAGAKIGFFGTEREALHSVHEAARRAQFAEADT